MAASDPTTKTSRPLPRTKPAAQRRRELLDAGLEVFTTKGIVAATLDEITRRAGVAKGTFYLHFESKEQLLAALQTEFESRLVERVDAAAGQAGLTPAGRLEAWLDAAFAHYPDDVALHDVLFHHPVLPAPPAPGAERPRDLVDSLAKLIGDGCTAGAFTVEDVELTAVLLCSALHSMFDQIWHRDRDVGAERLHAATRDLFRRGVRADATG